MKKTKCKFCDWKIKTTGIHNAHYLQRAHMKQSHPDEFERLEAAERQITARMATVSYEFGDAAKMPKMY